MYGFSIVMMKQVMLSQNGQFMLYQITLPFKNFSIEFSRVSCVCLGNFKTWCTLQVCTFFKVYQLVHYVLKQPFLVLKCLWCLGYNKCLANELSCYTYSLNYRVKFEFYLVLYLFIKTLIKFLSDKNLGFNKSFI